MGFIVIPSDFVEGVTPVVPIFVQDEDPNRVRIAKGWIDGVVEAADKLRTLARRILSDEWRASELADEALQVLWKEHGDNIGLQPHRQIYQYARWKALDKSVGSIRQRQGFDVVLLEHMLVALREPLDLASHLEAKQFLERLMARLAELGETDVLTTLALAMRNGELAHISEIGKSTNTVSKRFWRTVRKVSRLI
jgi:DNA-directed RNA polymerase specialized sigma24 family protein